MNVSRETTSLIDRYLDLLSIWNRKIRLVGPESIGSLKTRWTSEAMSLAQFIRAQEHWVDLGSGSGLPVVILACVAKGEGVRARFTAIESDRRKAVFLREAAGRLELPLEVIPKRIETVAASGASALSAKALASLPELLRFAEMVAPDARCYFLKGPAVHRELVSACTRFKVRYKLQYESGGVGSYILIIEDHRRA
ncbi:MAG: RsmG family class I SAM-dependent methyltransferase [Pseudomonadota bacterium]